MRKLVSNIKYNKANITTSIKYRISATKVLQFHPRTNTISDKDIMSLFMGIVRLIRDNERNKILQDLENELK